MGLRGRASWPGRLSDWGVMSTQATKIQSATATPNIAGVSSSFDPSKGVALSIPFYLQGRFFGELKTLWVYMTKTGGDPTAATMRLCKEPDGDLALVTDTESIISFGLTSTTAGTSVWRFDIDVVIEQEMLYFYLKTDTGTITINKVVLTYR